jgi:tetratricopeptide (TPR) repeat protein
MVPVTREYGVATSIKSSLGEVYEMATFARQLLASGRAAEAEAVCRKALTAYGPCPALLHALALVLHRLGRREEAIQLLRKAVESDQSDPDAGFNLGVLLAQSGDLPGALEAWRRVLAIDPGHLGARRNLATALVRNEEWAAAEAVLAAGSRLFPNDSFFPTWLGHVDAKQDRLEAAAGHYTTALTLDSGQAVTWALLCLVRRDLGDIPAAITAMENALTLAPDHADYHFELGELFLMQGRFERGWPEYEWRRRSESYQSHRPTVAQPQWTGDRLEHRTILLHAEQGIGDNIQCIRYAPLVKARGGTVVVECPRPLMRLLATVDGIDRLVADDEGFEAFDCHLPLMSLPGLFRTTAETVPGQSPYLSADPAAVTAWSARLEAMDRPARPGLRVGLVWSGNPQHRNDVNRSVPVDALAPLLKIPGVSFFSLQKEIKAADLKALRHAGPVQVHDLSRWLTDLMETAAAISALDLVISADTAVLHITGALGRPAWLAVPFVPDWRWLLRRTDSPWYPSARLFRQPRRGDWSAVFETIAEALHAETLRPRNAGLRTGTL